MRKFVLIVDDDEDLRETFALSLQSTGFDILTAAHGKAALEVLRRHGDEVGLILLDVLMPVMNGWQFLEERSKSKELEDVPTIVLSAAAPSNPISSHATGFLSKPVTVEDLRRTVRSHFKFDTADTIS
jgi:two-component system, chemotaxis family, chemotaxis protein CheY